jgi:shikimate kinase
LENKTILGLEYIQFKVISPGGSVIYSPQTMNFLKDNSIVVYLSDSYSRILNRIRNLNSRGIVGLKNKSFEQLYNEREQLYKKYADFTIDMSVMSTVDKWKKYQEVKAKIFEDIEKL